MKKREYLFDLIVEKALAFSVGIVDEKMIDKINILNATLSAMKISSEKLSIKPDLILIDGNKAFISDVETKTIVKGDNKSFVIAAASIIAKVTRDRIMLEEAKKYPNYFWRKTKVTELKNILVQFINLELLKNIENLF